MWDVSGFHSADHIYVHCIDMAKHSVVIVSEPEPLKEGLADRLGWKLPSRMYVICNNY